MKSALDYTRIQAAYQEIQKIQEIERDIQNLQEVIQQLLNERTSSVLALNVEFLDIQEDKPTREGYMEMLSGWASRVDSNLLEKTKQNKLLHLIVNLDESTQLRVLQFIHAEKITERNFYIAKAEQLMK
jgi:hypothetical protein